MNHVYLMGRAVSDPDIRETATGNSMARFTIALDKRLTKSQRESFQKEGRQTADFVRIIAWNGLAKTVSRFLRKGARLCVSGSISTGYYEVDDGERRYYTDVVADEIKLIDMPEFGETESMQDFQADESEGLSSSCEN